MLANSGVKYFWPEIEKPMKLCVAQTRPRKGDVTSNLAEHKELVQLAVHLGADMILFPELSVTGYEPHLAHELATHREDDRLNELQQLSMTHNITVGVGMPVSSATAPYISTIILGPQGKRLTYSKQYLHADELPFFAPGKEQLMLGDVALATCYELSVPEHSEHVHRMGAKVYIASVAKTAAGIEKAHTTLAGIAKKYGMTVLLSNCVGHCDDFDCGGRSAAWNDQGELVATLGDESTGLLLVDTRRGHAIEWSIK